MTNATIQILGHDVLCQAADTTPEEHRLDGVALLPLLVQWSARYDQAVSGDDADALLLLGLEMFEALDKNGWASAWMHSNGARRLTVQVTDSRVDLAGALLNAPWELLAGPDGHLAGDDTRLFELTRRIGRTQSPLVARYGDVKLMFMAAAPEGAHELDFEAEEAAILKATERLPLHLVVEETGAADTLRERLALDAEPFDALHLSCHGDIDDVGGPFLALEHPENSAMKAAFPADLVNMLGNCDATPLVFLSACRTAQRSGKPNAGDWSATSYVSDLIGAGVQNVLGWNGSVYDTDAADFAKHFYGELALLKTIPAAAAFARAQLFKRHRDDPRQGTHWHLARLHLGNQGGGALAARAGQRRQLASATRNDFLDNVHQHVPVASRAAFVGRRRALQHVLRAFAGDSAGVLIHGMGNLGKSSLAARIRDRMTGHRTVVVFKHYDALAIFDRLLDTVPPLQRAMFKETWRKAIVSDATLLADALDELLTRHIPDQPILLVIDDLETILEAPVAQDTELTPVQAAFRPALAAVMRTFARLNTNSRLLITSRYRFTLPGEHGGDLAQPLHIVPLTPMHQIERDKQLRAMDTDQKLPALAPQLVSRVLAAAGGNPGLQNVLIGPLLKGEVEAAEQALLVWERYRSSGVTPQSPSGSVDHPGVEGNALLTFFRRMAFDTYRAALTDMQARALAACCVFGPDLPIPVGAMHAAVTAAQVPDAAAAVARLLALGLLDDLSAHESGQSLSVNPMARPLAPALPTDIGTAPIEAALPLLHLAWRDDDGAVAQDHRALELCRLALLATNVSAPLLDEVATVSARYLFLNRNDARRAFDMILSTAWLRLQEMGQTPSATLAIASFDCAERLGERSMTIATLEVLENAVDNLQPYEAGSTLRRLAKNNRVNGKLDFASKQLARAAQLFDQAGDERACLTARAEIADILRARGELDKALRINQEECLPVYQRLDDVRSVAVTLGKIADILQARGELDEALRIRQEECLPVYRRLGDVREFAICQGRVADILQARGELDEALRIRQEDQLPVHRQLGDVHSVAITQAKIADILQAHGELDEALRIYQNECLPALQQLGDVRSVALTQGRIADILQTSGELDEALRIRQEDQLPVYRQLDDVRSVAVTLGKIADILQARGELDEALRIYQNECLPAFQQLGDVRSVALTQGRIADILKTSGELDEALRVHQEDELPVYRRLNDVHSVAVTQSQIADILQARGDSNEALRIHLEECLPAFQRLGDVRSIALIQGRIADIHQASGE